jgi:WD40 repeat protein
MVPSKIFCTNCGTANRIESAFCFACGQPLQTSSPTPISPVPRDAAARSAYSSRMGQPVTRSLIKQRYRIVARLGNGGFGAVYKAEDTQFGNRLVAVKEMNRGGPGPEEVAGATEAFKREALLLAKLKHPSLPGIYDHFTDAGRWYLVMDYIEGETLEARLDRVGRLRVEEALQIGMQLGEVLRYLHACQPPIIFRDLKPANIIITPQGHVYLIDFGLARLSDPEQSRNSNPFGSPGYAAPEQYDSPQTTVRADIYSLGATLHQMITGIHPSMRPFEFVPIQFSPDTPLADFGALIMRMLEMNPGRRPESMATVLHELQHIANQLMSGGRNAVRPVSVQSPTPPGTPLDASNAAGGSRPLASIRPAPFTPGRATTPSSRGGALSFSSGGVTAPPTGTVFCVFERHKAEVNDLAWFPDGSQIASASSDKTVQIWNTGTGTAVLVYQDATKNAMAVSWSPDGARIAAGYAGDKRDPETLQIVRVTDGEKLFSYASNAGFWNAQADKTIHALAWSPDGARLACGGGEYRVDIWDARSWKQQITYKGHNSTVYALAWSPDGRQVASTGSDDAVHIWDAHTGRNAATFFKHSSVVASVMWSPNGQRIVSASHDKTAQVWNAVTGTSLTIYRGHSDNIQTVAWSPDGTRIASGGRDGKVQVWDASKGTTLYSYSGHLGGVNVVKWSPDGKRLASGGTDRTVHVWRAI